MRKIYLLYLALLLTLTVSAQANFYSFSVSSETYVPITGGTVITSSNNGSPSLDSFASTSITIPTFDFGGVACSTMRVTSNGSILFNVTSLSVSTIDYRVLSENSTNNNIALAPFNADLNQVASGVSDIRYQQIGNELVVQWHRFRRYNHSEEFSFQVRINTVTNVIKYVYSGNPPFASSTQYQPQIGIKTSGTNYMYLKVDSSNSWNTPVNLTTGISSSSTCLFNGNVGFTTGLTYIFTPPAPCSGVPNINTLNTNSQVICSGSSAQAIVTTNNNIGVSGILYQWEESDDNGVTDPWANVVGGTNATTMNYTPPSNLSSTRYYRLKITCSNSNSIVYTSAHIVNVNTNPLPATSLTVNNILSNSATLDWTNSNGNRRLVVINSTNNFSARTDLSGVGAYVANENFQNTGEQIIYDGTGLSATVTGLLCNTTYYVRVYEYLRCGTSPNYNIWHATSLDGNFITSTASSTAVNIPQSNNFTGFTGNNLNDVFPGWYERTGANGLNGTNSYWVNSSVFPGTTTAKVNLLSNTKNEWIISPLINVNVSTLIKFKAAITNAASSAADPEKMQGTDDTVQVMISTDACGTVWTPLYTFDATNTDDLTNVLTDYVVLIPSSYIGQNVRIAFKASEGTVDDVPSYDFHIGSISIEAAPNCPDIFQVSTSLITKNSVRIAWAEALPAPANGYEYEIRTTGAPGTPGAVDQGAIVPGVLFRNVTNLLPETTYQVYVRAVCSSSVKGNWSTPVSFTTLCNYPDLVSVTPGFVCGQGTASLSADYTSGTVRWFATETSNAPIFTGNTFVTPNINSTTSYWVNSISNLVTASGGRTTHGTSGTTPSNYGLVFNATSSFVLKTVDVYLASSTPGNLVVNLVNASNTVLDSRTIALPAGGTGSNPLLHTVELYFNVPVGNGLRLMAASGPSMIRDSSVGGFPYSLGNFGAITSGFLSDPTSTTYYYFYNWQMESGCNTSRTEVVASVTTAPELELSANDIDICQGNSEVITITSGASNYDSYTISPSTGVTGDATTGWTFNPSVSTIYTLVASQTSGNLCTLSKTINVSVYNNPVITTNVNSVESCAGSIAPLSVTDNGLSSQVNFGTESLVADSTTSSHPNTFSGWYGGHKVQMIYLASELTAKGMVAGSKISSIAFDIASYNSNAACNDFRIKIGTTNASVATATFQNSTNLQTVYNQTYVPSQTGWVTFQFTSPFIWDGVSNIIIETAHNSGNSGNGSGTNIRYSNIPFVGSVCGFKDSVTPAGVSSLDATTFSVIYAVSRRPNVILGSSQNGTTTWSPVTNLYSDQDATIPYVAGTNATNVYFKSNSSVSNQDYTVTVLSDSGCAASKVITTNVTETPVPVITQNVYCAGSTLADIQTTITADGTLKWYNLASNGTELPVTTELQNGQTYYVEQVLNGCTSASRASITVTINETPAPTVVNATQLFCSLEGKTLSDLDVNATDVLWYSNATSDTPLPLNTPLVNGTSYYASQTINGCESVLRVQVIPAINVIPAPTTTLPTQLFCSENLNMLSDINIQGQNIKWYDAASGGNELVSTTELVTGIYYASQSIDNCESTIRLAITVNVSEISAPTATDQSFCIDENKTINDIVVVGNDIKWYNSLTSTTVLPVTQVLETGIYYVTQEVGGCESERLPVLITIHNTLPPVSEDQMYCEGEFKTVGDLVYEGIDVKWYNSMTGIVELDSTELLTSGTYYATQTLNACESVQRTAVQVVIHRTDAPLAEDQMFCIGEQKTISDLVALGENIKWYASPTSSQPLSEDDLLVSSTYYATQTVNGCENINRTPVVVVINNSNAPTASAVQTFCSSINPTLANIAITGQNIKWYSSLTSTQPLTLNTSLQSQTYFATQTLNGCESTQRTAVTVTITQVPVMTNQTISVCNDSTLQQVQIQGYSFNQLRWYNSMSSTTILPANTIITSNTLYYVEVVLGTCPSNRVAVSIEALPTIPQPAAPNVMYVCGGGTLADLQVNTIDGGSIDWFNTAGNSQPLPLNTTLVNGTYYVSQKIGDCHSTKKAVSVVIISTNAPLYNSLQVCEGFKINEVTWSLPTGAAYEWFTTPTASTALPSNTVLTSGVYYVGRVQNGCRSQRAMVTVTVHNTPNAPTGQTVQVIAMPASLNNIIMDQGGIIWYSSYTNALNQVQPLANTTDLIDGATYYGVLVNENGCISLPTAVTVNLYLGVNDLDISKLTIYPNPTTDKVFIEYKESIDKVEVYSVLGQKVLDSTQNSSRVEVDLQALSSGTYMIKIYVGNDNQLIKVVKK